MRSQFVKTFIGLAAAVMIAATWSYSDWWGLHKSQDRSTNVSLDSAEEIGHGSMLPAGTYRMEVPENVTAPEVMFYQNGKLVAQAKAKVVSRTVKNPYTEVDSTKEGAHDVITEIRPGGWAEELQFSRDGS